MYGLNLLLFALYEIVIIVAIIHVLMDNRQPAKTMAWMLVIYFVPVVGLLFYFFFGVIIILLILENVNDGEGAGTKEQKILPCFFFVSVV